MLYSVENSNSEENNIIFNMALEEGEYFQFITDNIQGKYTDYIQEEFIDTIPQSMVTRYGYLELEGKMRYTDSRISSRFKKVDSIRISITDNVDKVNSLIRKIESYNLNYIEEEHNGNKVIIINEDNNGIELSKILLATYEIFGDDDNDIEIIAIRCDLDVYIKFKDHDCITILDENAQQTELIVIRGEVISQDNIKILNEIVGKMKGYLSIYKENKSIYFNNWDCIFYIDELIVAKLSDNGQNVTIEEVYQIDKNDSAFITSILPF